MSMQRSRLLLIEDEASLVRTLGDLLRSEGYQLETCANGKEALDRETISREELLNEVWGYDSPPLSRTVDVHIAWLRQKLENDPHNPRHILTVHGHGYRFAE
jgi:DNA-binding response OmpR family regulator